MSSRGGVPWTSSLQVEPEQSLEACMLAQKRAPLAHPDFPVLHPDLTGAAVPAIEDVTPTPRFPRHFDMIQGGGV